MWCLPFVLWRRNPVLFVCLKKEQPRWIIHAALQRQHSRLNDEGIYEILSLSLFFTHTFSPSHSSISLSLFLSFSQRGPEAMECKEGEDFTRRWGDGKTCPSNVSHRSQRGPDPKATSNLTLSFDLLTPLLTGNSAPPCSLFKPLWVCVCDFLTEPNPHWAEMWTLEPTQALWSAAEVSKRCSLIGYHCVMWWLGVHFTPSAVTSFSVDETR